MQRHTSTLITTNKRKSNTLHRTTQRQICSEHKYVLRNSQTKRTLTLPNHSLCLLQQQPLDAYYGFATITSRLSLRARQKAQMLFHLRHVSAGMAQTIKGQGEILMLHWKVRAFQRERKQVILSSQSLPSLPAVEEVNARNLLFRVKILVIGRWRKWTSAHLEQRNTVYTSQMPTVIFGRACLTSFGIRLQGWRNIISWVPRVDRDAPLPLGFVFLHPSNAAHRLADGL